MITVSPSSLMSVPSSSRLTDTPAKTQPIDIQLADSTTSSSKKRKITDAQHDDDDQDETDDENEDLDNSSRSTSPSKSGNTGRRKKASDEERKARLEARQARNRLSAQYSRERKKAYLDQLEGSLNDLKRENTSLREQHEQDQLVRQALDAKFRDSQIRIHTLETVLRTVAPSLVPLLGLSSASSSSPAIAAPSTSSLALQLGAELSTHSSTALLQNNGPASKEASLPLTIAAPASTASTSLSLGTLGQQTSNEDVRLPAA